MTEKFAKIGRPGIGGEFLRVERSSGHARYTITRHKQVNQSRSEQRQLGQFGLDLPASTMIYDLIGAIEHIVETIGDDRLLHLDGHGISGDRPSLRERLGALADGTTVNM